MNFPNKTISKIIAVTSTFTISVALVWLIFQTESLLIERLKTENAKIKVENPIPEPKSIRSTNSYYLRGRSDAERDVSKGLLKIVTLERTANDVRVEPILKAKYGIDFYSIGRFWSMSDVLYLIGYNEISEAAIEQKFGRGNVEGLESKIEEDSIDPNLKYYKENANSFY